MKKTLTFLSLMASMASSALAGTVAIAPAPVLEPALPEKEWNSAMAFEAVCALADQSVNPDLWGGRITFGMYKSSSSNNKLTHEVNVGVAVLTGNGSCDGIGIEMEQIPLTIGYNMNYRVADKWTAFAGAKLGVTHLDLDLEDDGNTIGDADWGFQWSLNTGLKYELRKNVDVVLSYEFRRVYADLDDKMPYPNVNVGYHVLSAGLVIWF
ncbi:MAG: outer membrane beta-barrel protein [Akkermansia sp.]